MSGPSPEAEDADERPSPPPRRRDAAMAGRRRLGAPLCCILCGVFTVYATISRGPLVAPPLVPALPAVPFFSPEDPVTDFFTGDLSAALSRAADGHASLLFFYAPWDAASQAARAQLVRAAHLLAGQVEVLAINCWHVTGDCRKKIKRIASYPFVVVSLRHGRGLQYSGPLEASHLVQFVQRVLRPLRRLETAADLALLQASSTAVAVGYTPFSGGHAPPSYFSLLRAALLTTEEQPTADLAWAVVTNPRAAARLRLDHLPGGLAVINWNQTMALRRPATGWLTAELIRSYVSVRRREASGWLELAGVKSSTLQLLLSRAAVLLVMDRRRPLAPAAHLQTLSPVRRVWLDYNNCNHSEAIRVMGQLHRTITAGAVPSERQRTASCQRWAENSGPTGDTDTCPDRTLSDGQPDSGGVSADSFSHADPGLQAMVRQQRTSHCRGLMLDLQQHQWHQGEPAELQEQVQDQLRPVNITGLRCTTNRTLDIYLLDSVRHAWLARRLGVYGPPGAVILDSQAESQYVLDGPVTAASLTQMIADYTAGRLERRLVSRTAGTGLETHRDRVPAASPGQQAGQLPSERFECDGSDGMSSGPLSSAGRPPGGVEWTVDGPSVCDRRTSADGPSSCDAGRPPGASTGRQPAVRPLSGLTEMTSQTFRQVALNTTQDVLVYFYSAGCGHCSVHYHVLLAAWRLFANSGLRVARIDGADNDLRWQFSLESFPTVMYLPAYRKSESRVFPEHLPLTLGYLLRFILANASGAVRHAFFYSQCDAACRATTAYKARRQAALVRRRQVSGARRTLARHAAELARLRRALRVAVSARTESDGS